MQATHNPIPSILIGILIICMPQLHGSDHPSVDQASPYAGLSASLPVQTGKRFAELAAELRSRPGFKAVLQAQLRIDGAARRAAQTPSIQEVARQPAQAPLRSYQYPTRSSLAKVCKRKPA